MPESALQRIHIEHFAAPAAQGAVITNAIATQAGLKPGVPVTEFAPAGVVAADVIAIAWQAVEVVSNTLSRRQLRRRTN
jgi:hypothetical protein